MSVRHKVPLRCECGRIVAEGSVFCPHCRAEIRRKNVKTMQREEGNYQKSKRTNRSQKKKKK